ncbi:MAG TPA: NrfD/PsrC family molybdoenzyme membrane anchor subunit [Dehalococcoidia bacterium]|nr:NrfD/PsrC family molybdoenzyme membrane anchor subunit [Dehalococcoidia bacterium]
MTTAPLPAERPRPFYYGAIGALTCPRCRVVALYYAAVLALSIVGVVAVANRWVEGLKVTDLSSPMTWGLWIALYIFFVGLSAGSFLLSTLIYVFGMKGLERVGRLSILAAILSLCAALLFVWIDLGHPERFWRVFSNWHNTSIMAWEFILYNFYIVLLLVELWFLMRLDLAREAAEGGGLRQRVARLLSFGFRSPATAEGREAAQSRSLAVAKVCGIIGIPTAIGVHGGTGAIFAVVISRPYWNTGLFPVIFIVSALASGAALITFLYAVLGRRDQEFMPVLRRLAQLMILFIAVDLLMLLADFVVGIYQRGTTESAVLEVITTGKFWFVFWIGEIMFAGLIPIILVSAGRGSPISLGAAGLVMLLGIVSVRLNLVIPAYVDPVLPGLQAAYFDIRFVYEYLPSVNEWLISVGLIATIALAFSLAVDLLPLGEEIRPIARRR